MSDCIVPTFPLSGLGKLLVLGRVQLKAISKILEG